MMRVITVNVPKEILAEIDSIVEEHGLYPSRSELVRVAVREFLLQEIQSVKEWTTPQQEQKPIRAKAPIIYSSFRRREVDIQGILAQIPNETE